MRKIARYKGNRRLGRPVEFPLTDGQGLVVLKDRRSLPDRRKAKYGIDDLKAILSKMTEN
jgi:hypothetical protein